MGEEGKQEQSKADEKKEEKTEEKKQEIAEGKKEETKPPLSFVLFVDLHCVGCANKIQRSISKITGVEGVVIDMAKNEITIKGVVDPQSVCTRITNKTNTRAKVLPPLPQLVASQVSELSSVELNVNMHCQACAGQLKRKILKMKGVRSAEMELSSGKVTVTGTMDADRLVDYVYCRTKKQAKIVPHLEPEKLPEEKKEEEKPAAQEKKDEDENKDQTPSIENTWEEGGDTVKNVEEQSVHRMVYYWQPFDAIQRIPAPHIFSDENPNACCIV